MTADDLAVLRRRIAKVSRRNMRILWIGLGIAVLANVPTIAIGFASSLEQGLGALLRSAVTLAIPWIPIILHNRKMQAVMRSEMISNAIIRGLDKPGIDDPYPRTGEDSLDRALLGIAAARIMLLAWGLSDRKGRVHGGVDPYRSHPDDRRIRLARILWIAAYEDMPDTPWFVRVEMIAAAQLLIAGEVRQSRSVSGRIRNLLLRAFSRRRESARAVGQAPAEVPA